MTLRKMTDELKVVTGTAAHVCLAPVDIDNQTLPAATIGWVDMSCYRAATIYIMMGVIGAGGSGTWTVQQATTSAGAGVKTIGTKTQAYTDASDGTVFQIDVDSDEMDVAGGFRYLRVVVVASNHSAIAGALIVREGGRYAATEA